jgi:hypothetical protein
MPDETNTAMKNKILSASRWELAARGLLLGWACLLLSSASAQNLLKNPGFESPLDPWDPLAQSGGKTNWTVGYASGGPGDFAMKDRSKVAAHSGSRGGHLRPVTECWCHAYFTQTVSNLTANASYVLSGWVNLNFLDNGKDHIYIELLGGPTGTTSVVSPDADVEGWLQHSVTNTASAAGTLEVRLHSDKQKVPNKLPGLAMYYLFDAYYDDFSLTPE